MKKDKYLFLSMGFLIGVMLSINLINLTSIMDDAIYMKDHIFILGDPGFVDGAINERSGLHTPTSRRS